MFRFAANTGFLWKELPFLVRLRRAKLAGFDALEFHDEAQRADLRALKQVLAETGLPVLAINCRMAETAGCAAIPGMEGQARADITTASEVAGAIGARAVHVLAGRTGAPDARETFVANLRFALEATPLTVLIEPISWRSIPGFYLNNVDQAIDILDEISNPRLKIMFDVFHVMVESGDLLGPFRKHVDKIGHVQIASYPERTEPEGGELDFAHLLPAFGKAGYGGDIGCEYNPATTVEAGLGWRSRLLDRMRAGST